MQLQDLSFFGGQIQQGSTVEQIDPTGWLMGPGIWLTLWDRM